jgi:hypothetical protein
MKLEQFMEEDNTTHLSKGMLRLAGTFLLHRYLHISSCPPNITDVMTFEFVRKWVHCCSDARLLCRLVVDARGCSTMSSPKLNSRYLCTCKQLGGMLENAPKVVMLNRGRVRPRTGFHI